MYQEYRNHENTPAEVLAQAVPQGESPFRPEYEEYVRRYPGRGRLKVQISIARGAYPLKNVMVDVAQIYNGVRYSLYNDVTDISGVVDNMVLPARSIETTLNAEDAAADEAEYVITIFHPDFEEIRDCAVVIHDRIETILPISLVPITGEGR
jgi:hypothetical protein